MNAHTTTTDHAARYLVGASRIDDPHTEQAQDTLRRAYRAKVRPQCLCRPESGAPMYIARAGGEFIIKRMPGSGMHHAPACRSWLPPDHVSGYGRVAESAIVDDPDSGMTLLRLDFSLSKRPGAAPPDTSGEPADTVSDTPTKLTLRAMLHYLWDEAELTEWRPGFAGHRSWPVIFRRLRAAGDGKTVKKSSLADALFVPEPFDPEHKSQINARRHAAWTPARAGAGKKLMILVGEIKKIEPARIGHRLIIKHMPGCPLALSDELYRRLYKRFGDDIALWETDDTVHLVAIATFAVAPTGLGSIDQLAVMTTDEHWIPFDSEPERLLTAAAIGEHRSFRKSLRYTLADSASMAALVFTDTTEPTAAYIDTPISDDTDPDVAEWHWDSTDVMPELPQRRDRR